MSSAENNSPLGVDPVPGIVENSSQTVSQQVPVTQPTGSSGSSATGNSSVVLQNSVENLASMLALKNSEMALGQARLALLESMALVPVFTGEDPSISFNRFQQLFEQNASYFYWSEQDRFFALQQKLAGRAYSVFNTYRDSLKTSDEILKMLKDRFTTVKHVSEVMEDFWNFAQPEHLSVTDYIAQARQKVRAVSAAQNLPSSVRENTEKEWLLAMLFKNLNINIRRGVIARNPATVEELETIARCEELAWLATKSNKESLTKNFQFNPQAPEFVAVADSKFSSQKDEVSQLRKLVQDLSLKFDSVVQQVGELAKTKGGNNAHYFNNSTGNFNSNSSHIFCYYCNQPGHVKKFCPLLQQGANNFNNFYPRGGYGNNRGGVRSTNNFYPNNNGGNGQGRSYRQQPRGGRGSGSNNRGSNRGNNDRGRNYSDQNRDAGKFSDKSQTNESCNNVNSENNSVHQANCNSEGTQTEVNTPLNC